MIVFNVVAIAQIFIALLPALAVAGVAHLVGGNFDFWLFVSAATLVVPIDGLWRLAGIADGEDEDGQVISGRGVLNVLLPSGGGHLFFIPNWIVGGAVAVGICSGLLS